MTASSDDTIFALASASGRAGVAVIRISGPGADGALQQLMRKPLPPARRAVVRTLFSPASGERLDTTLVLRFETPHSYTGENIVEIQGHGGSAVVDALLSALSVIPGLRMAEAGEFTRRAVQNGRLDLTQAEAIADLVNAETEAQRKQALRQYDGQLGALYEDWRGRLIRAAAWVEAVLDFPDEEIPPEAMAQSRLALAGICKEIEAHLQDGRRGEILRDGLHVAVIGPPNAGKSSLVNALARRDVAIVSETPGTTRDVIEVRLDLQGYPVILADTAGLRDTVDGVEQEGVRRARARAESADLRLLVLDGTQNRDSGALKTPADLVVLNKADQVATRSAGFWVSAKSGEGLEMLINSLAERAKSGLQGDAPVLSRARHRQALEGALKSLTAALTVGADRQELAAEHIRRALRDIGRITGRVDLDELLDVVFRDFCIGK